MTPPKAVQCELSIASPELRPLIAIGTQTNDRHRGRANIAGGAAGGRLTTLLGRCSGLTSGRYGPHLVPFANIVFRRHIDT